MLQSEKQFHKSGHDLRAPQDRWSLHIHTYSLNFQIRFHILTDFAHNNNHNKHPYEAQLQPRQPSSLLQLEQALRQ